MNKLLISVFIVISILTSGCSKGLFSVHKLDIQQGNSLKEEDVAQITNGMTKDQVQELLGTPVLEPVFQTNRWDYLYYLKEPDTKPVQRIVSIYFEDDSVIKIE